MRKPRLSYANVVATLALFVALGGTSYAAATITGRNVKNSSLTGADVKNSSLTGKDVKNNSLTGADVTRIRSADVSDGALLAKDFKTGQLPQGAKGDQGAQGLKGDKGEKGTKGDKGDTGPPGPTDGKSQATTSGGVPSTTPETFDEGTETVTTTAPGKFLVLGRGTLLTKCDAGSPTVGLYVDNVPVPGSGFTYAVNAFTNVNVTGVSAAVGPGTHTITMRTDCVGGTIASGTSAGDGAIGAVALGGGS